MFNADGVVVAESLLLVFVEHTSARVNEHQLRKQEVACLHGTDNLMFFIIER